MNNLIVRNSFKFIILFIVQILIFDQIKLFGHINASVYILFVILFPISKNRTWILITSFLLGFLIDIFTNGGGIHAASITFIAFIRYYVLQLIMKKSFFENQSLSITQISLGKLTMLIAILVFVHGFILYSLEMGNLLNLNYILYNTIISGILTLVLCFMFILLFVKRSV